MLPLRVRTTEVGEAAAAAIDGGETSEARSKMPTSVEHRAAPALSEAARSKKLLRRIAC